MGTYKRSKLNLYARLMGMVGGLLSLMLLVSAPIALASPPAAAGNPGQSGVLVKNYWGHDMTFTIADTEYTIPADGQLFIALTPGDYTFSATVPGEDSADRSGEVILTSSEKLDLSFAASLPVIMTVEPASPIPVTGQAQPNTAPTSAQPSTTQPTSTQRGQTGVLVKNYWGQDLNFTIGDNQYDIPANGQLFVPLTPGDYLYSANVSGDDRSDQNGALTVSAGHTIVLSSYLNSPYTPFVQ